jgi:hypothetical protein
MEVTDADDLKIASLSDSVAPRLLGITTDRGDSCDGVYGSKGRSSSMTRNEIGRMVFSPVTTPQLGRSIMKARFAAALIVASIGRKHGNTLIGTLRKTYGDHFAEGCRNDEKLGDMLHKMDEPSLSKLLHDRERGKLDEICRHAA